MLATVESCTGGLPASLLTDVDGVGHVFDRGYVVYTEHAKCQLIGLAREKVDRRVAVSREVAVGALIRSDAEIAFAITNLPTLQGLATNLAWYILLALASAGRPATARHISGQLAAGVRSQPAWKSRWR